MSSITVCFPHHDVLPQQVVEKNASFFSRPADCTMQVGGVPFEDKVGDIKRSMRLTPKQGVHEQLRADEATHGNHLLIREGWS